MAKRVMDDDHKAKLTQGRIEAKAIREIASELFDEYGNLLQSWKFWKAIAAPERENVKEAIRKADLASLSPDICDDEYLMTIVCPHCQSEIGKESKFCPECGTQISCISRSSQDDDGLMRSCPECGRENRISLPICGGCGTDVNAILAVQDIAQKMRAYTAEKKWTQIEKEYGLLPESPRLPGEKGGKLLAEVESLYNAAAQIEAHLSTARAAAVKQDWPEVMAAADKALALDDSDTEAKMLRDEARSHQLRVPDGFRLAPGSGPEPYTNTVWAAAIIHEKSGIELVYIPAGTFTMGSPTTEADRGGDETQHQVTISHGFYLGKYEVTQAQWEKVTGKSPSHFKNAGAAAPVENVSWDDCQAFCEAAGSGLRLPQEAEWEYACRAGTTTALYSGDIKIISDRNAPALDPIAWYGGNSGVTYEGGYDSSGWPEKQEDHKRAGTHPVGQKKPNAWGLYDMIGNVWEWCQDKSETYPAGPVTLKQPAGPAGREKGDGAFRVVRGGGWLSSARFCRSAYRFGRGPDYRVTYFGLRVACSAPPVQ